MMEAGFGLINWYGLLFCAKRLQDKTKNELKAKNLKNFIRAIIIK